MVRYILNNSNLLGFWGKWRAGKQTMDITAWTITLCSKFVQCCKWSGTSSLGCRGAGMQYSCGVGGCWELCKI